MDRKSRRNLLRLALATATLAFTSSLGDSLLAQVTTAAVKVDHVAGSNKVPATLVANESTRISSRRMLSFDPPTKDGAESPSDRDASNSSEGQPSNAKLEESAKSADEKNKLDENTSSPDASSAGKPSDKKPIAPPQPGKLEAAIRPTNTDTRSIGTGMVPENAAGSITAALQPLPDGVTRGMLMQNVHWQPANICHFPLYFEDAMLERHGHVRWGCAQPLVSGAKFITTLPLLPYITTLQPPCEPRYSLGHFRPGNCAPALKDHLPWDRRAATVEVLSAGAYFWAMPL